MRHAFVMLAVLSAGPLYGEPPSFLNDVMPVLTKAGCNSGGCHGKGAGQNGFCLSLRGYAPEQDHFSIVREFAGRRVNRTTPEDSLILAKATGHAPHGGGPVLDAASPEYQTLLNWVAAGAPAPNAKNPKLVKLELPTGGTLKVMGTAKLRAIAHWSDYTTTDVSRLSCWDVNDAAVLAVDNAGGVTAKRPGASVVRAAFLSEVAVASFVVPHDRAIDDSLFTAKNIIDQLVNQRLRELRLPPSPPCDDATFLRRAMLDALGTLPTPSEVRAFLSDTRTDKRTKLVDVVLARPEFAPYWSLFLSDLLQNRRERDHDVRGASGVNQFHGWLFEQLKAGRGWDAISRDVLLARGSVDHNPAVGYWIVTVGEHREIEKSEAAESVAQTFLGTRIGCARCHNHPLERFTQDDFYHFSAYFKRLVMQRADPKKNLPTVLHVRPDDLKDLNKPVVVRQPRTGRMLAPQTLDRAALTQQGDDARTALVEWMIAQPSFRQAMANRLWKQFLGTGLVEPVDDLRATNPPSNPALFSALGDEFAKSGYDFKHLMRQILNSETYQRSSATRPENAADMLFHSHYLARRLPAEVLLDAVSNATGVPEKFAGYPIGWRAVQVAEPAAASPSLKLFGSSERTTACACERTGEVTLPQALTLLNGERIPARLQNEQGVLMKLLANEKDDAKAIEELFLRTFSRLPGKAERDAVMKLLKHEPRDEVFRDLMRALLNSKEFVFNH